ncbi:MAG: hypothetical protein HZA89_04390 [Verrucomicrobia bacterium]|nr:hypothetical protein [Verrucomicrobiota bacterium]
MENKLPSTDFSQFKAVRKRRARGAGTRTAPGEVPLVEALRSFRPRRPQAAGETDHHEEHAPDFSLRLPDWVVSRSTAAGLGLAGAAALLWPEGRPLALGLLSVALALFAAVKMSPALCHVAALPGAAAMVWSLAELRPPSGNFWPGAATGGLLLFDALVLNRSRARAARFFFTGGALLTWLVVICVRVPLPWLGVALAGFALGLGFSFYVTRVREVAYFGQESLVAAQAVWLWAWMGAPEPPPGWNPLLMTAATLASLHWWQRQKALPTRAGGFHLFQSASALALAGIFYFWLEPQMTPAVWMVAASLLAIVFTGYGMAAHLFLIAECGQIFLGLGVWEFAMNIFHLRAGGGLFALVPVLTLAANVVLLRVWLAGAKLDTPFWEKLITFVSLCCGSIAISMSVAWMMVFLPLRDRFWFCVLVGGALFFWGDGRQRKPLWMASAGYLLLGWGIFWLLPERRDVVYPMNFLAILFFAALQQLSRMNTVRFYLPEGVHNAAMLLVGTAMWLFVTNWVMLTLGLYGLAVHWTGVGLCGVLVGVVLRERLYQIISVGMLGAALAKALFE